MSYRNGTYIAFHANNSSNPAESDFKYYNTLKMWKVRDNNDFYFINSHDKTGAVRDTSKKETLERSLKERLNDSKNMILIIGDTTRFDTDWVPVEIEYAIDKCNIPIIAVYVNNDYLCITDPAALSYLWPKTLKDRIMNGTAKVIHIPFKEKPLTAAIDQFSVNNYPTSGLVFYTRQSYINWGYINQ